jgi:hypothetical protein
MEEGMKRCNRCGAVKPLTEFYVCSTVSDGRQGTCSDCVREKAHLAYLKKMNKTETVKRHTLDSPIASKEGYRVCTLCGEEKPLDEFEIDKRKELGHTFRCKTCARAYKSKWVKDGGDEYKEKNKAYREENRDMLLEGKKRHYYANHDYYRHKGKEYYREHIEQYLEYSRKKHASHIGNALALLPNKLRIKVRGILFGTKPHSKNDKLVGCSAEFFREYIKALWKEGMTWENYGNARRGISAWQIDHIVPVSSFDLSDPEQILKCFHYTNLQPLWWEDNAKKYNNIT